MNFLSFILLVSSYLLAISSHYGLATKTMMYKGSYGSPGVASSGYGVAFKKLGSGGFKDKPHSTVTLSGEDSPKIGFEYKKEKHSKKSRKSGYPKKVKFNPKKIRARRSPALDTLGKPMEHAPPRYGNVKKEIKRGYGYY